MPNFDERFVTMVRGVIDPKKVYHYEIVQKSEGRFSAYPCAVYHVITEAPEPEMNDRSGVRTATFAVMCMSKDDSSMREMTTAIDGLAFSTTIATANGFLWIEVENITDEYQTPFEYDETAIKNTVLSIKIMYREDT